MVVFDRKLTTCETWKAAPTPAGFPRESERGRESDNSPVGDNLWRSALNPLGALFFDILDPRRRTSQIYRAPFPINPAKLNCQNYPRTFRRPWKKLIHSFRLLDITPTLKTVKKKKELSPLVPLQFISFLFPLKLVGAIHPFVTKSTKKSVFSCLNFTLLWKYITSNHILPIGVLSYKTVGFFSFIHTFKHLLYPFCSPTVNVWDSDDVKLKYWFWKVLFRILKWFAGRLHICPSMITALASKRFLSNTPNCFRKSKKSFSSPFYLLKAAMAKTVSAELQLPVFWNLVNV